MIDVLGLARHELEWYQVLSRTILVFVSALIFVRIAGMRTFGTRSAFDVIVTITLGAVLSRCITGHYPFFSTLGAAALLALLHRLISYISARNGWFNRLVAGESRILFKNGHYFKEHMHSNCISPAEMIKAMHENNIDDIAKVESMLVENDGVISVVKKEN